MGRYQITFAHSAQKELEALDAALVGRIFPRIEALADDPRPAGCRKLQEKTTCGGFASAITGCCTRLMMPPR